MIVGNRSYQSYVSGLAELVGLEEALEVALSQASRAGQDIYSAAVRKQQGLKEKWDELEGRQATLVRRSDALARRLGSEAAQDEGSKTPTTAPVRSIADIENALRDAASDLAQGEESQAWVDRNVGPAVAATRTQRAAPAPVAPASAAPAPPAVKQASNSSSSKTVLIVVFGLVIVVLIVVLLFVLEVL
jgi:hypothetical protein